MHQIGIYNAVIPRAKIQHSLKLEIFEPENKVQLSCRQNNKIRRESNKKIFRKMYKSVDRRVGARVIHQPVDLEV